MKTDEELQARMHPLIKAFYGEPFHINGWASHPVVHLLLKSNSGLNFEVADVQGSVYLKDGIHYTLNNKWYSEEEMLRIIRIKAFI
jgi:hypothetical protein